ncbi:MAG: polysaccharide export outer membrane protein [Hyphomicrobiaceae bacterium]|jgi:polysaccharide export outer membrane protein
MRPCLFGVLSAIAIVIGGCSHISTEQTANALGRAFSEPAPLVTKTNSADGWAPIIPARGGSWDSKLVRPVSNRGPHAVAHTDGPYKLDSGDQLRIFVYGQPNLSRIYTVDHSGNIMMPLIGVVRAQRHTTYRLASTIRSRLGARFVRDPQVTVDIHQNRPFFILGEVRTPGQYPYVNGMTVETAVAIAGGYTPRARKRNFRISRRVDGAIEIDKGSIDYVLQPGDTINVAERFF